MSPVQEASKMGLGQTRESNKETPAKYWTEPGDVVMIYFFREPAAKIHMIVCESGMCYPLGLVDKLNQFTSLKNCHVFTSSLEFTQLWWML